MTDNWAEGFWANVPKLDDSVCWEWSGYRSSSGYGQLRVDGRKVGAHRVMYEVTHHRIPDGLHVCHRCDNPPCVNPSHLFLGTAKDNARDRQEKGRFTPPRFDRDTHPRAKLTIAQCRDVAARHRRGHGGNTEQLASEYGTTIRTINKIAKEFK